MTQPLVSVAITDKRFGAARVLGDAAFEVRPGEFVSLVGPSGCGKSTLLRIVSGLDGDYRGAVTVLGAAPRLHAKDVGVVFQEPRLLPWLTVAQNIGFEAGASGAGHPRTRQLLGEVGLPDHADAYPKQLSGGMAQRAAIARGLFGQPRLLLLDEPFSAVDAFTRMRLQDLLLDVAARHHATLLMITHDIDEAIYLSDRVLVMASGPGRIAGEIAVTAQRPRNRHDPSLATLALSALRLLGEGDTAAT